MKHIVRQLFLPKHFLSMRFISTVVLPITFLLSAQSSALKTIQVLNNEKVTIEAAKDAMTRIGLKDDRIAAIYGEGNNYDMEQEAQLGQLMLRPLINDPFWVTIITEKGNSIDLMFKPQKKEPETVLIEVAKPSISSVLDEGEKKLMALSRDDQLTKILVALVKNERPLGFYESKEGVSVRTKLKLIQSMSYRRKGRIAQVLMVQNSGRAPVYLREKLFAYKNVEAVAISRDRLKAGEIACVYVVRAV